MTTFKDYLSLDTFTTYFHNMNSDDKSLEDANTKKFYQTVLQFMIDINKEQPIGKISNDTGHVTNTQHNWNKILEVINKENTENSNNIINNPEILYDIESFFRKIWFFSIYKKKENFNNEDIKNSYVKLVNILDSGNINIFELPDENYCFECGHRFQLKIENWIPSFTQRFLKEKGKEWYQDKYENILAEPCATEKIVEITIEFKTGHLLAADWFRIEEFTKIVDNGKNYDVNCSQGRIDQSKFYAENYNFISTPSGGSTEIFEKNGNFMVGYHNEEYYSQDYDDENEEDNTIEDPFLNNWKKVGTVDSGLRAITIIEKETLLDIISKKTSPEKAVEILDNYIKDNSYNITQFTIKPGKYTINFCGTYYNLKDNIDSKYKNESFEPFLLIENNFDLTKKFKM